MIAPTLFDFFSPKCLWLLHIHLPYWSKGVDNSNVNQKAKDEKNQTINNITKDDEKENKKARISKIYSFKPCRFVCFNFFRYKKTHL